MYVHQKRIQSTELRRPSDYLRKLSRRSQGGHVFPNCDDGSVRVTTRIWTGVDTVTTWSTNHYTMTTDNCWYKRQKGTLLPTELRRSRDCSWCLKRKECLPSCDARSVSVATRIRTGVATATTWSTNHYTMATEPFACRFSGIVCCRESPPKPLRRK